MYFFFFFKQKTAYEMRISDWSSDVCSSDLAVVAIERAAHIARGIGLDDIERLAGFLERGALVGKLGAALATSGEDVAGGTRIALDGTIQRRPPGCGRGWRHAQSHYPEHANHALRFAHKIVRTAGRERWSRTV